MRDRSNRRTGFFNLLETVVTSLVWVALGAVLVFRPATVMGPSMRNTLQNGQRVLTLPLTLSYDRGDIVVVRRNGAEPIVKRIVGLAGDKILIKEDGVYLNGTLLEEPYAQGTTYARDLTGRGTVTVPEGHVFVLGDNRENSDDSRMNYIGMIDERNIFGRVVWSLTPHFGGIE